MPIYEFKCGSCSTKHETMLPITAESETHECPYCHAEAKKIICACSFTMVGASASNGYSLA